MPLTLWSRFWDHWGQQPMTLRMFFQAPCLSSLLAPIRVAPHCQRTPAWSFFWLDFGPRNGTTLWSQKRDHHDCLVSKSGPIFWSQNGDQKIGRFASQNFPKTRPMATFLLHRRSAGMLACLCSCAPKVAWKWSHFRDHGATANPTLHPTVYTNRGHFLVPFLGPRFHPERPPPSRPPDYCKVARQMPKTCPGHCQTRGGSARYGSKRLGTHLLQGC